MQLAGIRCSDVHLGGAVLSSDQFTRCREAVVYIPSSIHLRLHICVLVCTVDVREFDFLNRSDCSIVEAASRVVVVVIIVPFCLVFVLERRCTLPYLPDLTPRSSAYGTLPIVAQPMNESEIKSNNNTNIHDRLNCPRDSLLLAADT